MRLDELRKSVSQMTPEELQETILTIRKDRRNFGRTAKKKTVDKLELDLERLENIIAKHEKET